MPGAFASQLWAAVPISPNASAPVHLAPPTGDRQQAPGSAFAEKNLEPSLLTLLSETTVGEASSLTSV